MRVVVRLVSGRDVVVDAGGGTTTTTTVAALAALVRRTGHARRQRGWAAGATLSILVVSAGRGGAQVVEREPAARGKFLRFVFQGRVLQEEETLVGAGIGDGCVVHCAIADHAPPAQLRDPNGPAGAAQVRARTRGREDARTRGREPRARAGRAGRAGRGWLVGMPGWHLPCITRRSAVLGADQHQSL